MVGLNHPVFWVASSEYPIRLPSYTCPTALIKYSEYGHTDSPVVILHS
jgi:hypothetical protein